METTREDIPTAIVLAHCQEEVLGSPIEYSLLLDHERSERHYRIRVERGEEKGCCDMGDDLINAVKFFEAIIKGQVFPYSLSEIVEDFCQA